MLALLGGFRCCVEIADLVRHEGLVQLNADQEPAERLAVAQALLPQHEAGDPLDLVYCWDLLNYLKPLAVSALMMAIRSRGSRARQDP